MRIFPIDPLKILIISINFKGIPVSLGYFDALNFAQGLKHFPFHLLEVVNWLWGSQSFASSDEEIVKDSCSAVSTKIYNKIN